MCVCVCVCRMILRGKVEEWVSAVESSPSLLVCSLFLLSIVSECECITHQVNTEVPDAKCYDQRGARDHKYVGFARR